jgi:nitroimidazol reductase NimA-like FMN-containing flavoprotein (pyridoxamine 5'-phosphate oxidase superfamily)
MSKIVNQIRNMEIIEAELKNAVAGLLSFSVSEDKIAQIPSTFIYLDKNIYLFFEEESELYDSLEINSLLSFSVIKSEKGKKSAELNFTPVYRFISVKLVGLTKKIDDLKLIDELNKALAAKYYKNEPELKYKNIIMIDTEEIQASEEIGG